MAKNAVVRVVADTKQYDNSIDNAAKKLNRFGKDGLGALTDLAGGWGKLVPAIGAAVGAHQVFDKALQSSQALADGFARAQAQVTESVGVFFEALTSGDWSAFNQGLDNVIAKAGLAQDAIDQLGNSVMSLSVSNAKDRLELQKQITAMKESKKGTEEYAAALESARKIVNRMSASTAVVQSDQWDALAKQVATGTNLDAGEIQFEWVFNAQTLDATEGREARKKQAKEDVKAYNEEYAKLQKEYYTTKAAGFVDSEYVSVLKEGKSIDDYKAAVASLNQQYGESLVIERMLSRQTDERLNGLDQLMIAYYGNEAAIESYKQQLAEMGRVEGGNGGGSKKVKDIALTLEDVKVEMEQIKSIGLDIDEGGVSTKRLQDLIKAAQDAASNAVGTTATAEARAVVNELQTMLAEREFSINVKVAALEGSLTKSVNAYSNGQTGIQDTSSIIGIEDAAKNMNLNGVDKGNQRMQKGIDLMKEWNELQSGEFMTGISAMTGAFQNLGDAIGGAAGSVVSLIGTMASQVVQGVATIASLYAQEAAYKEEATAAALAGGAKAMEAHSWIPFVGVAMGVGMVATLIATLSNMPKFAEGGVATKATLGVFGEAGPEAIIPLDRLERMLNQQKGDNNSPAGRVEFHIKDSELYGVLVNYESKKRRI